MKCIIGLGNIGKEYEYTRHNMGFMCIDRFMQELNIYPDKKLKKCIYAEKNINGEKVIIVKPTTFMNLSGEAIVELVNWFKLDYKDICIIYDDVDLMFGEIRYRLKGSSGTHNGMRNIITLTGTENLTRIRVGIEAREDKSKIPLYDYVLGRFNREEIITFEQHIYPKVKENIHTFLTT